jgi:hypothetical protein
VVGLAGIEPATSALSVLRSNRLSYSPEDGKRSLVSMARTWRVGSGPGFPAESRFVTAFDSL